MSFETKIINAAARNTELLSILAETDLAVPTLELQKSTIAELKTDIANDEKTLHALNRKLKLEEGQHLEWQNSHVKRLFYHMGGSKGKEKFNQRAEKEEREYIEAENAVLQQQNRLETLRAVLAEAEASLPDLQSKAERNQSAQSELDALYEYIFGGTTPLMPEEDAAEARLAAARTNYSDLATQAIQLEQAINLLKQACKEFRQAVSMMSKAHNASTMDMMGGGTRSDMVERDSLSSAHISVLKASNLVQQARFLSSAVASLPDIEIAQGHGMGDIIFDNIFSDMSFHNKIKDSEQKVRQGQTAVELELKKAMDRQQDMKQDMEGAAIIMETERRELQHIREMSFRRYASGKEGDGFESGMTNAISS